jgi:hypothetical protein
MSARDLPRCVNEAAVCRRETIMNFFNESRAQLARFVLSLSVCLSARHGAAREKRAAGARWVDGGASEKASGAANYHTLQTAVTLISLSRLITHSSRPSSLITVIVLLFLRAAPSLSLVAPSGEIYLAHRPINEIIAAGPRLLITLLFATWRACHLAGANFWLRQLIFFAAARRSRLNFLAAVCITLQCVLLALWFSN